MKEIRPAIFILLLLTLLPFGSVAQSVRTEVLQKANHCNPLDSLILVSVDTLLIQQANTLAAIPTKRPSFFRRIINYYSQSNVDRTFEKKIDISVAPGPNYSSDVGFGLGVMAAGLYRLDRTDSITAPSNITIYSNITTKKFFLLRFSGNNIFMKNRNRLSYSSAFVYFPAAFYGIGYQSGQSGYVQSLDNIMVIVRVAASTRLFKSAYVGVSVGFDYTRAKPINKYPGRSTFEEMTAHKDQLQGDQKKLYDIYESGLFIPEYTTPFQNYINGLEANPAFGIPKIQGTHEKMNALNVNVGAFLQYDSRDFITDARKGIFFKAEARYYPKALGNSRNSFGKILVQFDFYQKLWKGMVLAYDLYSDFALGTPSWHMYAQLGGTERMRGYYQGRYRDRNLVETQVEFRQKIYRRHGIVGWIGVGNIWGKDSFQWGHTLTSFGVGYRFEFKNRMNIRLDYGWGNYGNQNFFWDKKRSSAFIFSASEAF
ncbi:MAG: hypothetical protein RR037_04260 [Alistipes sp.]